MPLREIRFSYMDGKVQPIFHAIMVRGPDDVLFDKDGNLLPRAHIIAINTEQPSPESDPNIKITDEEVQAIKAAAESACAGGIWEPPQEAK